MTNCTHPKEFIELSDNIHLVYSDGDVIEVGKRVYICRKCGKELDEFEKKRKHRLA